MHGDGKSSRGIVYIGDPPCARPWFVYFLGRWKYGFKTVGRNGNAWRPVSCRTWPRAVTTGKRTASAGTRRAADRDVLTAAVREKSSCPYLCTSTVLRWEAVTSSWRNALRVSHTCAVTMTSKSIIICTRPFCERDRRAGW